MVLDPAMPQVESRSAGVLPLFLAQLEANSRVAMVCIYRYIVDFRVLRTEREAGGSDAMSSYLFHLSRPF